MSFCNKEVGGRLKGWLAEAFSTWSICSASQMLLALSQSCKRIAQGPKPESNLRALHDEVPQGLALVHNRLEDVRPRNVRLLLLYRAS